MAEAVFPNLSKGARELPKVSVIIPTYNREDFIVETVGSVLAQTIQDYEIMVTDDGSTDGTWDALKQFDDRIKYIYQENRGRSSARNLGILNSTGKYVLFLDSDDLLLPHALETLSSYLDTHFSVGVVYSDGYYCDENGRDFRKISTLRPSVDLDKPLETLALTNFIIAPHCAIVRRSSLEHIGPPFFDETLDAGEDTDLWIRLAAYGCCFGYVDVITCKYRWHRSNTYSPLSRTASRAWESLRKSQFKILNSAFFHTLSLKSRQAFFHQLLLHYLGGDTQSQQAIFDSSPFKAMPSQVQAALCYYVGVYNIVYDQSVAMGRQRLKYAVRLAPHNAKYRTMVLLSHFGSWVFGCIIRSWRKIRQLTMPELPIRSAFDPRFLEEDPGC
jgi:glycosyltransferase involved in cell wall biosynthesis